MAETPLSIACGELRLEGMLARASGARGVVVTHPHPLYGGDMDNPVVMAVCRAYRRKGFSTLRFNFRGVGASGGRHDQGVCEREDVRAAGSAMAGIGLTEIDLAGYSFGSWVNASAGAGFRRMVMVSPPLAFIDFGPPAPLSNLHLIVTGGRDEIAPPELIERIRRTWNPAAAFEVVPGADHFYSGRIDALEAALAANI
ncbi:MAG: alpha/beta hydrolase [Desulfobacterales bacterium]|jgi:hypothetical protein|nr:alpha/beta hydrolase [Desulfobacterales bacterium]